LSDLESEESDLEPKRNSLGSIINNNGSTKPVTAENFKPVPTAEKEKCQELYSFEVLDVFF
jgi:hypothetical protein